MNKVPKIIWEAAILFQEFACLKPTFWGLEIDNLISFLNEIRKTIWEAKEFCYK
jgi:hypothetical protein